MPGKRKSKSAKAASSKKTKTEEVIGIIPIEDAAAAAEALKVETEAVSSPSLPLSEKSNIKTQEVEVEEEEDEGPDARFISEQVPDDEARRRWPHRYQEKGKGKGIAGSKSSNLNNDSEEIIQARCHYTMAEVDSRVVFNLEDDAHVKADEGREDYICRIIEMFEGTDGSPYFTAQWYYRAKDTVIQSSSNLIDNRRVFFSEIKDDNPLNCLIERLRIVRLPLNVDLLARKGAISNCDYYCDTKYLVPYSSFVNLPLDNVSAGSESDSTLSSDSDVAAAGGGIKIDSEEVSKHNENKKVEMTLLDLYCGCGAMSTGLCLGANMCDVNLVTKWAVDQNPNACESLKYNHPETEVRNETAEDFLALLKEWEKLCGSFLIGNKASKEKDAETVNEEDDGEDEQSDADNGSDDSEVFEVENVLAICYGDPNGNKNRGLHFKIHWKGYGSDKDSWEPQDCLGNCQEAMKEFVVNGYHSKMLPLPGDVDVVCGGPPCQGISGFNRFRNNKNPLEDLKNRQLLVFMDIVDYLKPRFVLMENVVDIVKFSSGFLGRYALGRLVGMNYQARLGIMAAGAYGLPQFRMRVFMWGAHPSEKLPQYALPTHNVVLRGGGPTEFEGNVVAYEEGRRAELEKELFLKDAISDLPPVKNDEGRDEMPYNSEPMTEFQQLIRSGKDELLGSALRSGSNHVLFDHRPLRLNDDDYQRVCHIPKRKGANFRDLEGVRVRGDNKVEWDPNVKRVYLSSGKPLVPDYAMTFVNGGSSKPFGRLWWDETVPTVVTRAEPHNQVILHPEQDRVLTIRENARLQGFPDYYKLFGGIKERYIQVGNAVAVPVSRALGYALALATKGSSGEEPLFTLPKKFPRMIDEDSPAVVEDLA